jgi:dipeptidyl aminopeptidase/acylaminoacyl peptidase
MSRVSRGQNCIGSSGIVAPPRSTIAGMRAAIAVAILVPAVAACGAGSAAHSPSPPPPAEPPPYASAEPITRPQIFAPGAISTADPEFAISFSADGRTAYFDRANADRSKLAILSSSFTAGAWQPASPVSFSTGEFRDVDPFVFGDRLYFSSTRPRPGSPDTDFDTWYVERRGAAWSDPIHFDGAPSGPGTQVFVTVARDGTLYFQSDATGGGDLYRSSPVTTASGTASYPSASPIDSLSTPKSESNPAISPDGTLLIFVSDRDGGLGGADLYASRLSNNTWSPATNLGPLINSPLADFAPAFSPDGRYLFFTSERPGIAPAPASGRPPGDIYQLDVSALRM